MKSVLISIQPKWCELIANGKKTVEVRKTRPKIETPFKCYIYCTNKFDKSGDGYFQGKYYGKVIGEFVCDKYTCFQAYYDDEDYRHITNTAFVLDKTGLTLDELFEYTYGGKNESYGWHISDLVIYDEPKAIECFCSGSAKGCFSKKGSGMKRPPQSWCYVEEVEQ